MTEELSSISYQLMFDNKNDIVYFISHDEVDKSNTPTYALLGENLNTFLKWLKNPDVIISNLFICLVEGYNLKMLCNQIDCSEFLVILSTKVNEWDILIDAIIEQGFKIEKMREFIKQGFSSEVSRIKSGLESPIFDDSKIIWKNKDT